MLDEELSNAPKLYYNRRLMKLRGKVAKEMKRQGIVANDVTLELEHRKITSIRDVEFKTGSAKFADPEVAISVLDQIAVMLVTCNQIMATEDREPNGPVTLSIGITGPESGIADARGQVCKEQMVKKLFELNSGSGVPDSLIQMAGQTEPAAEKAVVEVRVIIPGDVGTADVMALANGDDTAAPLPQMFNELARDHCLIGRSTDYDPFHTWLPHELRKTNPWPVTGPKKPEP